MLIVQHREEPGPQIGTGLPEMLLADRPDQAALDKIIGAKHFPGQRARIAAQAWDLRLQEPTEIVHDSTHLLVVSLAGIPAHNRYTGGLMAPASSNREIEFNLGPSVR